MVGADADGPGDGEDHGGVVVGFGAGAEGEGDEERDEGVEERAGEDEDEEVEGEVVGEGWFGHGCGGWWVVLSRWQRSRDVMSCRSEVEVEGFGLGKTILSSRLQAMLFLQHSLTLVVAIHLTYRQILSSNNYLTETADSWVDASAKGYDDWVHAH